VDPLIQVVLIPPAPPQPGYIFNLKTTGLAPGTWELRFRIAGDPTEHGAGFQIR